MYKLQSRLSNERMWQDVPEVKFDTLYDFIQWSNQEHICDIIGLECRAKPLYDDRKYWYDMDELESIKKLQEAILC